MIKAYFYIHSSDLDRVSFIFNKFRITQWTKMSYHSEPNKLLIAFHSTPTEQKALYQDMKTSCIPFCVIE